MSDQALPAEAAETSPPETFRDGGEILIDIVSDSVDGNIPDHA